MPASTISADGKEIIKPQLELLKKSVDSLNGQIDEMQRQKQLLIDQRQAIQAKIVNLKKDIGE